MPRDFNPTSRWRYFNFADYPTAITRWLLGDELYLTGATFPSFLLGVDLVDPEDNEARSMISQDEAYARSRGEIAVKSLAGKLLDENIYISASYRFFYEIDPPSAVQRADLDQQDFLAISLELPKGFSLTYSTGKLPLDSKDDDIFDLGWELIF